jgi:hypothetical protein
MDMVGHEWNNTSSGMIARNDPMSPNSFFIDAIDGRSAVAALKFSAFPLGDLEPWFLTRKRMKMQLPAISEMMRTR